MEKGEVSKLLDEVKRVEGVMREVDPEELLGEAEREEKKGELVGLLRAVEEVRDKLKKALLHSDKSAIERDPYIVARMYYEQGLTQEQIAERLAVSRPRVRQLLDVAAEAGIYRPLVVPPKGHGHLRHLEAALEEKYGLREVVLVPGRPELVMPSDETSRREESKKSGREEEEAKLDHLPNDLATAREAIVLSLAQAAAQYLDSRLKEKRSEEEEETLCVSWGYLLNAMASFLKPTRILPKMTVVPMVGFFLYEPKPGWFEANLIAYKIATAYHARYIQLPIPAIVRDRRQRKAIKKLPMIQKALEKIDKATFVVTSLGHANPKSSLVKISKGEEDAEDYMITQDDVLRLLDKDKPAVGEICSWYFNGEGNPMREQMEEEEAAIIPIGLGEANSSCGVERFKAMAADKEKTVVVVVGANRERLKALEAALRGRLLNVLITDDATAKRLLGSDGSSR